ncbi:hypothetical protein DLE01_37805, partial [Streptomyces sp. FT05W]
MGGADGVDRWQIDDVEPHRGDGGKPLGGRAEGAADHPGGRLRDLGRDRGSPLPGGGGRGLRGLRRPRPPGRLRGSHRLLTCAFGAREQLVPGAVQGTPSLDGQRHRPGRSDQLAQGVTPQRSGGLRIVRLANFVTPASGGLRTALDELGRGYLAAGHEPVLIVPGAAADDVRTPQGRVITLPGPVVPGTGGYRVLTNRGRLRGLLEGLRPDRLEVSDRTTLRWTGEWARRARVPAVMVSHETADGVLRTWGVPPAQAGWSADRLNARSAHAYARIVCTTEWAEREFLRIGARNVVRAPLGVDLRCFRPDLRSEDLRARHLRGQDVLLLLGSRLSVEKRPGRALDALAALRRTGVRAALVVAGDGPLRAELEARARAERLPAHF